MRTYEILGYSFPLWLIVPAFYFCWIFSWWSLKKLFFLWINRLTQKTVSKLDDILVAALDIPLNIMIFVWGTAVLFKIIGPDSSEMWSRAVVSASKLGSIVAIILFIDRFFSNLLRNYAEDIELLRISQSFTSFLLHAVVWAIGLLIVLDSVGISITPIIASLGIGSLAVALALQPTLENVFSGVHILLDKPIMPGHFVKLDSGDEGYVERIGWRTTWIRQLSNNMVIIPNKNLVNAKVTNYYYPSKEQAVVVDVGVHYNSDLEKVERVTIEVAREVMKQVSGGVPSFEPFIRFSKFSASSIDFAVIMQSKEFVDNYLIKHEFIRRLARRYSSEGIIIPYPVTAVNTSQEKATFQG